MGVLEIIAAILIIGWIGGLILNIAGGFIHILLVIALILVVLRFIG